MQRFWHSLDPRRTLAASVGWLVVALSVVIALGATAWLGRMARNAVLQQHARQLTLTAHQFAADLDLALSARLQAIRAAAAMLRTEVGADAPRALRGVLDDLQSAYPELEWIGFANPDGTVVAATAGLLEGSSVAARPWFAQGLRAPWIGGPHTAVLLEGKLPRASGREPRLADLAVPVRGRRGRVVGVLGAHLSWAWLAGYAGGLRETLPLRNEVQAMVLDDERRVLVGPVALEGKPWNGGPVADASRADSAQAGEARPGAAFERLDDGRVVLVSRIDPPSGSALHTLGWRVQLIEPSGHAYRRADVLWMQILAASLALGAAAGLFGVLTARRLIRRLVRLTRSVEAVGSGEAQHLEVPSGVDEVARVGSAFADVLGALQRERSALHALGAELEQRVAARTREVERLAEETRYAAVVRERLKIARDLHDTLAHSMMAMLSEVRFLRKLQVRDPGALPRELAQAEQVAHEGLKEARAAISQMRFNAVRDVGLGSALGDAIKLFTERSGLDVTYVSDPRASSFGDERAETLFRIAQEALRNVERHARAGRVTVTLCVANDDRLQLTIEDDGIGFDPDAPQTGHYGVLGLREQAQLIGANLKIQSMQGQGTTLRVELRLSPVAQPGRAPT